MVTDDNKRNLMFFESSSVRELYDKMDAWQQKVSKRLHLVTIHKDGEMFCCIALTNPAEVIIVDPVSGNSAFVESYALCVTHR
jgi:hypothetical protein